MPHKQKIGFVCCSNGQTLEQSDTINQVSKYLEDKGYETVFSPYMYAIEGVSSGTAQKRAEAMMQFYHHPEIAHIMDLSGGDLANEVIPYLDFDVIRQSHSTFWGYSDLTTIINSIYAQTGKVSILYQMRHILHTEWQDTLFDFDYTFIQGAYLDGIVVGGNIRCLLKLAGTPFWPDMHDKILFLESRGGQVAQIITYLNQLAQIGVFKQVHGVLLGQFTEMENKHLEPSVETLLKQLVPSTLPIAKTHQIGHSVDSKAMRIGARLVLK